MPSPCPESFFDYSIVNRNYTVLSSDEEKLDVWWGISGGGLEIQFSELAAIGNALG